MTEANPYSPPQTHVADVVPPDAIRLATRGQRLRAVIVDAFVSLAIGFVLFFPLLRDRGLEGWMLDPTWWYRYGLSLALYMLINGPLLYLHGQTVGKKFIGTRIARPDGSRAGMGRILGLRMLVPGLISLIPILGGLFGLANPLFIFRADRRCLHDHIAGTVVILA